MRCLYEWLTEYKADGIAEWSLAVHETASEYRLCGAIDVRSAHPRYTLYIVQAIT